MLLDLAGKRSFFQLLHATDLEMAEEHREKGCGHCGGPLHQANYTRKPRGGLIQADSAWELRRSFCCGHCRRRSPPPSILFMGRRVYWGFVVLVLTALRQGRNTGASQLRERLGVDPKTLKRWVVWFEEIFPVSSRWKSLRGRLGAEVGNHRLPSDLLDLFLASEKNFPRAVTACLRMIGADFGPAL